MLEGVSGYIKNIAFFLIFSSFIGIILPDGKYKKYIDIVLGLVLIIMTIEPLAAFIFGPAHSFDSALDEITKSLDQQLVTHDHDEEARERLITEGFKEQINLRLEVLVRENGYNLDDMDLNVDLETFAITRMDVFISKQPAKLAATPIPLIRIEKIQIGDKADESNEADGFDLLCAEISDTFGLPVGDIHIYAGDLHRTHDEQK